MRNLSRASTHTPFPPNFTCCFLSYKQYKCSRVFTSIVGDGAFQVMPLSIEGDSSSFLAPFYLITDQQVAALSKPMATVRGQVGSANTILRQVDRLSASNTTTSAPGLLQIKAPVTLSGNG